MQECMYISICVCWLGCSEKTFFEVHTCIYNGEGMLSLHIVSNVWKFQWDCDRSWRSSPSFKFRGSARQIGNFAFCAMFEMMYAWMYMRYPNDNLEYDRIDPGDSNNTYRKTLEFRLPEL